LGDPGFEGTVQNRFCIGARGKVDSVFVLSDVPIDRAEALMLDGDSRTSNLLARLLAEHWWGIRPAILPPGTPRTGADCAVVAIGDKAVPLKDKFRYGYDLAAEWAAFTAAKHGGAMPFVFAVWVHRAVESRWLERWYAALEDGVAGAAQSAKRWAGFYDMAPEKAEYYLTQSIDYLFDEPKQRALSLFLELSRVKV
jgi:chorismate dehydratase